MWNEERIAIALERIADALEKKTGTVMVDGQLVAGVLAKAARREPTSGSKS